MESIPLGRLDRVGLRGLFRSAVSATLADLMNDRASEALRHQSWLVRRIMVEKGVFWFRRVRSNGLFGCTFTAVCKESHASLLADPVWTFNENEWE